MQILDEFPNRLLRSGPRGHQTDRLMFCVYTAPGFKRIILYERFDQGVGENGENLIGGGIGEESAVYSAQAFP